jgi:hypothetical protein
VNPFILGQGAAQAVGFGEAAKPFLAMGFAPPSMPTYNQGALDQMLGLSAPPPEALAQQPSPPFDLGADAMPGVMQDPSVQNPLRDNLLMSLAGLRQSQLDTRKINQRNDRSRFGDELAAKVLHPLWGGHTDHREEAWKASKNILDTLESRDQARRDGEANKMSLVKNLSDIIQKTDPNDFANELKNRREDRLQDKENFNQKFKADSLNQRKNESSVRERHTKFIEELATKKETRMDSSTKQQIAIQKESLELRKQSLQQQIQKAAADQDWKEYQELQDELRHNEDLKLRTDKAERDLNENAIKFEQEERKRAAETNKDGDKKNPDYKPVSAEQYKAAVAPTPKTNAIGQIKTSTGKVFQAKTPQDAEALRQAAIKELARRRGKK